MDTLPDGPISTIYEQAIDLLRLTRANNPTARAHFAVPNGRVWPHRAGDCRAAPALLVDKMRYRGVARTRSPSDQ